MRYFAIATAVFFVALGLDALLPVPLASATRGPSCECQELRAIRQLLEAQSGLVCDGRRCLPAPTPTVPNGGELP